MTRLLEAVCLVILVLPPAAAQAQTTPAAKPPIEQPAAVQDSLAVALRAARFAASSALRAGATTKSLLST
jgi:hypothetical protein